MKRGVFLKHLKAHDCVLADLNDVTCRMICKQLGIPFVK